MFTFPSQLFVYFFSVSCLFTFLSQLFVYFSKSAGFANIGPNSLRSGDQWDKEALAKLVNLDGVPEMSRKDPQIGNRLNQLKPLLDNVVVVKEITPEMRIILGHPNGNTVNDIFLKKPNLTKGKCKQTADWKM